MLEGSFSRSVRRSQREVEPCVQRLATRIDRGELHGGVRSSPTGRLEAASGCSPQPASSQDRSGSLSLAFPDTARRLMTRDRSGPLLLQDSAGQPASVRPRA